MPPPAGKSCHATTTLPARHAIAGTKLMLAGSEIVIGALKVGGASGGASTAGGASSCIWWLSPHATMASASTILIAADRHMSGRPTQCGQRGQPADKPSANQLRSRSRKLVLGLLRPAACQPQTDQPQCRHNRQ